MPAAMKSGVIGTKVSGVANGALGWVASGRDVNLTVGNANVGGAGYARTAPTTSVAVPANTNSSLSRRDRLVLRRSVTSKTVTPTVITGTPAASPVAPAITQNSTTFDLKLFSFLTPPNSGTALSSVIDERNWVSDGTIDEMIFSPFLGETQSTAVVTVGPTFQNVVSVTVTVPEALDEVRRIRVHGYVFCQTASNTGSVVQFTSSRGWAPIAKTVNEGSLNGDFVLTRYDTDLTPGTRTYNLQVRATIAGGSVLTRSPEIMCEII